MPQATGATKKKSGSAKAPKPRIKKTAVNKASAKKTTAKAGARKARVNSKPTRKTAAKTTGRSTPPATRELPFRSYDRAALDFLAELSANNDRSWFKDNQERYEQLIREPTRHLIRTLEPYMAKISPQIVASDKKVGGSMMRPQRDTRFSTNKEPYKTNVGVHLRHAQGKDVHAPGFYFHFDLDECFLGVGLWHPESSALTQIRGRLNDHPRSWRKLFGKTPFGRHFELSGDSLKRPPKGYAEDHSLIEDLKRKDFIAVHHFSANRLFRGDLPTYVARHFTAARGFMAYLHAALGLSF